MLPGEVSVGRILPNDLKSCAWPLLKAMFGGGEGKGPSGFFSLTQDATEATLIMDDRCRAAFDEAAGVAAIEYAPNRWRVLELHLGSLAWEVPGLVCFLATLMAESKVSILNLSSNDRDFMLVQESDVASATRVILERLQHDVVGLKADISHKAMVRRSENTFDDDAFDDGHQGSANGTSAVGGGQHGLARAARPREQLRLREHHEDVVERERAAARARRAERGGGGPRFCRWAARGARASIVVVVAQKFRAVAL
jgi:hypothetical protein